MKTEKLEVGRKYHSLSGDKERTVLFLGTKIDCMGKYPLLSLLTCEDDVECVVFSENNYRDRIYPVESFLLWVNGFMNFFS
jgi:hypothetical protein